MTPSRRKIRAASSGKARYKNAEQILVLDDGEIIASGTHDQLLDVDHYYRNLAAS